MLVPVSKVIYKGLENWSEDQEVIEKFKKMNIKTNFHFEPLKILE